METEQLTKLKFEPSRSIKHCWCWCCWCLCDDDCNKIIWHLPSQDHLVSFQPLTILTGQGHISELLVASQIPKSGADVVTEIVPLQTDLFLGPLHFCEISVWLFWRSFFLWGEKRDSSRIGRLGKPIWQRCNAFTITVTVMTMMMMLTKQAMNNSDNSVEEFNHPLSFNYVRYDHYCVLS